MRRPVCFLLQTVHSFSDFDIQVTVGDKFDNIVFKHDGFGNDIYRDAHVGILFWLHVCFEVGIF